MRLDSLDHRRRRGRGLRRSAIVLGALVGLALMPVLFNRGSTPELAIEADLPAIGPKTKFKVTVRAPNRGLRSVELRLRQGEVSKVLETRDLVPEATWTLWVAPVAPLEFEVELAKRDLIDVRAKEASLEAVAVGAASLLRQAPVTRLSRSWPLRLKPPRLAVLSDNIFVTQGGAEAVVYIVGESAVRSGVQAGGAFFPGYRLPGGEAQARFCLFAVPYDLEDRSKIRLTAEDDVGNLSSVSFVDRFMPKPFTKDTIRVTDRFMNIVVPRILAKTPDLEDRGALVDNYIMINSELRALNSETLVALSKKTERRFYWEGAFVQMPAKVVSTFADRRTYLYDGKKIDQQDHLGFDLASVKKASIPAANRGRVLFAGYLGIYGNTVVIDHGYGLQSLYSHMSKFSVEVGDIVEKGTEIGRTGATGLALGDHLHFGVLLHGHPVNPLEWWDAHWIHDRLELKLEDALKAGG